MFSSFFFPLSTQRSNSKPRLKSFLLFVFVGITSADKLPSDQDDAWSLRHSRPDRDGRFLSVPVYYGNWVPIENAKAKIESVASAFREQGVKPDDVITSEDIKDSVVLSVGSHIGTAAAGGEPFLQPHGLRAHGL